MSTITLEDKFSSKLMIESPPFDEEIIESPPFDEETIESPPFDEETIEFPLFDEETIESPPSDEETDNEEFSFSSARFESVSADDVFNNGEIRPVFPFFDQTLVKNILVESPSGLVGKLARDLPETCEKSNSTGFSQIWRFREMGQRSNSDGRDTFVFMKRENERRDSAPAKEQNGNTSKREGQKGNISKNEGQKGNISKKEKGKTAAFSAHYVESRERRKKDKTRTYLPYKPGFFGIFTSIHGGLSKNVHPY